MAATERTLRAGPGAQPTLSKIVRFLAAIAIALGAYVGTAFLLIAFVIGNIAGGTWAIEWSDTFTKVFLGILAFHALIVVLGSVWLARLLAAPVLLVLLTMAALLSTPWVVAAVIDSGSREVPNPSTKPGDHVERTPPERGPWTIEEARAFDEFALYWAGEEFSGFALSEIRRHRSPAGVSEPENKMTFLYGTCEPPGGLFSEGGCSPPLSIIVQPYCERAHPYPERTPFRGEAQTSPSEEGSVYVWTGDAAIKIYAWGVPGGAPSVADALVSINGMGPTSPDDPLPPVSAEC